MNTVIEYRRNRRGEFVAGYGHTLRSLIIVAVAGVLVYSIAYIAQRVGPIMPVEEAQASELLKDCVKDDHGALLCDFTSKSTRENMGKYVIMHNVPDEVVSTSTDAVTVEAKIRRIAYEEGLSEEMTNHAVDIARCESGLDVHKTNGRGNKPVGSVDRGLWMFNGYHQKRVSDACAFSVECSTREAIKMIKAGKAHLWVCHELVMNKKK